MAHFIDGFVFPIPRNRLNEYQRLAQAAVTHGTATVGRIWAGRNCAAA